MKNSLSFHFKGYDRVRAIYKLKQSINKFGDKTGKKNNILNNIKRKDIIGKDFVNLTINKIKLDEIKSSFKITLLNKKIQNNGENNKKEESYNKKGNEDENEIKKSILEDIKFTNENELLSSSYDYRIKETDLFSKSNKKDNNSNNHRILNKFNNQKSSHLKLISNIQNFNTLPKNRTHYHFYNLLNNKGLSPIYKNYKFDIKDEDSSILKTRIIKSNNNILYIIKNNIPKFRNLKLGTRANTIKNNCRIIKLDKNLSSINCNKNETNIKTRTLFYSKYKKKKQMKLKKIKMSKTQIDLSKKENDLINSNENLLKNENTKNFGQQTNNNERINLINYNFLRRIYSYIRLPNINRINFPKEKLNYDNNDCGVNFDFYNNNYFYLKDIKNQSINKIYMINPFIRNRIINNLK